MTTKTLLNEASLLQDELIENRRFLHRHAETGFALDKTLSFVKKELEKLGFEPKECGKSGLTATLLGKSPLKKENVLLLRADMDALPIPEEANVDFAADNGNMHACGHDMHTAMLLGAAKLLKAHENELCGTVKFMFQPAEEILEGAKDMIENGVLKKPSVQAAIMFHVIANSPLPCGSVLVSSPGVSAPAADYFTIQIQGKGCHGSTPQEGVDSLTVASHIVIALQEISARELGISDEAVLTIGKFQAGKAGNVIADSAILEGTLRSYDEKLRTHIKKRILEISQSVATAFRAKAETSFTSGCPTLINDETLSVFTSDCVKELLGKEKVFSTATLTKNNAPKSGASEDFSYISHEIPSITLGIAAGKNEYPLHHPKVQFDENALCIGSAVFAYVALQWLASR